MSALVTKWRNNIRLVDGVRWRFGASGELLYRHDPRAGGETWSICPPSYTSENQKQAWANRVIMSEARKRLKHAQRIVRALGGET